MAGTLVFGFILFLPHVWGEATKIPPPCIRKGDCPPDFITLALPNVARKPHVEESFVHAVWMRSRALAQSILVECVAVARHHPE